MKRVIASTVFTFSAAISLSAQGLVNFANTPTTQVFVQAPEGSFSIMSGPAGSYYFELFFGTPTFGGYTATGIYATNTGVDGLFSGGGPVSVPGWAAGTSQTYWVGGWPAGMGHDFNPIWFNGGGEFGGVGPGTGVAGNGSTIPVLNLFDGSPGTIMAGLSLRNNTLVPEPTSAAIAAVGTSLVLWLQRKRKRPPNPK